MDKAFRTKCKIFFCLLSGFSLSIPCCYASDSPDPVENFITSAKQLLVEHNEHLSQESSKILAAFIKETGEEAESMGTHYQSLLDHVDKKIKVLKEDLQQHARAQIKIQIALAKKSRSELLHSQKEAFTDMLKEKQQELTSLLQHKLKLKLNPVKMKKFSFHLTKILTKKPRQLQHPINNKPLKPKTFGSGCLPETQSSTWIYTLASAIVAPLISDYFIITRKQKLHRQQTRLN
ncbi:MAG: hypothetical protein RLZ12_857, partial [Bacillota bacterium]